MVWGLGFRVLGLGVFFLCPAELVLYTTMSARTSIVKRVESFYSVIYPGERLFKATASRKRPMIPGRNCWRFV